MKRLLRKPWSTRAGAVVLVLGVAALAVGMWGYGSEVIGSICNDGWPSDSTGQGRCSSHGGVLSDREVNTFLGMEPVSWIDRTRWPLVLGGLAATLTGGSALGAALLRRRFVDLTQPTTASGGPQTDGGFLELHVSVERAASGGRTTTVTGPDGSTVTAPFEFSGLTDRGAEHLTKLLDARHKRRFTSNQTRAVEALGDDLFAALFPAELEPIYRRRFDSARKHDVGLRLVLELDEITADLPWEYLHDKERASFLALSAETSVCRMLPVNDETRPQAPLAVVRILVMGSCPVGVAEIDVEHEKDQVREALSDAIARGHADVEFVSGGTLEDLRDHVERFRPHVFHFVGHGVWDNEVDDGQLLFETRLGHQEPVTGRELGVLLVRSGLRLVVLNSCDAARSSQTDRFSGIATSLVAQGTPGVLAMQYPIEDRAAATFGSMFLRQLALTGSIDAALTEARQGLFAAHKHLGWGTPVLTTRVPVQQVLPLTAHTRALASAASKSP